MSRIRSFIAIDTPAEVKERTSEVQEKLKTTDANVRWESKDKFHITVKFLGGVEASMLGTMADRLRESLNECTQMNITYRGVGCFPNPNHPRVIWIGAENKEGVLARLYGSIEEIAASFGVEREERQFHAHITIGRVKGERNIMKLIAELDKVDFEPHTSIVKEILLMRSDLKPTGSVYTVLQRLPLKGN